MNLGIREGLNVKSKGVNRKWKLILKQNLERFHKESLGLRKKPCTHNEAQGHRTSQGVELT